MRQSKIVLASEEADHYEAGQDWEADKIARVEKSEQRAWRVAYVSVALAFVLGGSLAMVARIPRAIPYLFAWDKATGNVEQVEAIGERSMIGFQDLRDKNYAQRYVIARESYSYQLLQKDYDDVLRWSSDDIGTTYAKLYDGDNARDKKYGANVIMTVTPVSVQLVPDAVGTKAVVRFAKKTRRSDADNNDPPQYYVATIAYEYKPSLLGKEMDLIANPDGYKVTSYRVDAELSAMPSTAPQSSPVAVVPAVRMGLGQ
jgi:type IV secretion system protein VirB8